MTQQLINVGTAPDDHTGDPPRTAFQKVNANFTENYAGIAANASALAAIQGNFTSALSIYDNSVSGLTATTVQAAIDEILSQRIAKLTVLSSRYGVLGDNSTDNATAINNWIAAANVLQALTPGVQMVLVPNQGNQFKTTGRHAFNGAIDLIFYNSQMIAIGSDDTAPLITHGSATQSTGIVKDLSVTSAVSGHNYYNPNFVGIRLLNKNGIGGSIGAISFFTRGLEFASSAGGGFCAYNTITVAKVFGCKHKVVFINKDTGEFCSENKVYGPDLENTGADYGSGFGMVFTNDYDTGHPDHSGNFLHDPCFQIGAVGRTWTSGGTLTTDRRYYEPQAGAEWLCKAGGVAGANPPNPAPAFVNVTGITISSGSAVVTMASTAGLSANMHVRGMNPMDAFPENTYIQTVDSGVQLTLTKPCATGRNGSGYKATFTTPTIDGGATLIYLGPYRKSPAWIRGVGTGNGFSNARWEAGVGEPIIVSGFHLYGGLSAGSPGGVFKGTVRNKLSITEVNKTLMPAWLPNTTYAAGSISRPTSPNGTFWDLLAGGGGNSGGAEPTPGTTVGTTFADGALTWIIRAIPTSADQVVGDYTADAGAAAGYKWDIEICDINATASVATINDLHYRAIGSATGWVVRGVHKTDQFGVNPSATFAAADLFLGRNGLFINSTAILLGTFVNTASVKNFRVKNYYADHTTFQWGIVANDENLSNLPMTTATSAYHRRIQSSLGFNSGLGHESSTTSRDAVFLAAKECKAAFLGYKKSATATCLTGFSVAELRNYNAPGAVQLFDPYSPDFGPRGSLGAPTSGFFLLPGEFIQNLSTGVGVTTGYFVATAGILAPAWVTLTAYVKGQIVTGTGGDANRVYVANGTFTSGTAPTGTTLNQLDGTATGIASGDVATWSYLGVKAVLTASAAVN